MTNRVSCHISLMFVRLSDVLRRLFGLDLVPAC